MKKTTHEIIEIVNAHADRIAAMIAAGNQPPGPGDRRPEARAFHDSVDAYAAAVDELDTWQQEADLGNGCLILLAPDGTRIHYAPENGVERLSIFVG